MTTARYILSFASLVALTSAAALAAPPAGIGAGVGASAHGSLGAPPMGVPRPAIPPVNIPQRQGPPVTVPVKADAHANANARLSSNIPMHGTLTAITGNTVTVRLANGSTQTFTVTGDTATDLKARLNKPIEFRVANGLLTPMGDRDRDRDRDGMMVTHGVVTAVNGNTIVIREPNGTSETLSASAQTAARVRAFIGRNVSFRVTNGTFAFAGAQGGPGPLHAKLTAISGNTVTVLFPAGNSQTFTVAANDMMRLKTAHIGKPIEFFVNADGSISLDRGRRH
ncbi:MAG TPA: hypothetical protein VFO29_10840 [Candidatus Rubrimentiphilum sp.]|nr:hypothetical protein [Candidatus Rubrimentiphilum sp.]